MDFIREAQLEFARESNIGGTAFTQAQASGLQPVWEEWLGQCRDSFDFYEHQFGHRVERLVLTGGAAGQTGFKEWVQEDSGLPVTLWDSLGGEPGRGSYVVAMGLALRGLQG